MSLRIRLAAPVDSSSLKKAPPRNPKNVFVDTVEGAPMDYCKLGLSETPEPEEVESTDFDEDD